MKICENFLSVSKELHEHFRYCQEASQEVSNFQTVPVEIFFIAFAFFFFRSIHFLLSKAFREMAQTAYSEHKKYNEAAGSVRSLELKIESERLMWEQQRKLQAAVHLVLMLMK